MLLVTGGARSEGGLQAVQGAPRGRQAACLGALWEEVVAALHRVIVLVWGRRDGRGERRRGRGGRGITGAGGVALGGGVVLGVGVIDERNMGLRVLYPEFWVGHEVVDG